MLRLLPVVIDSPRLSYSFNYINCPPSRQLYCIIYLLCIYYKNNQFRNIYTLSGRLWYLAGMLSCLARSSNQWYFRRGRHDVWSFMTLLGCRSVRDQSLISIASVVQSDSSLTACPSTLLVHSHRYHRQPSQTVANAVQPRIWPSLGHAYPPLHCIASKHRQSTAERRTCGEKSFTEGKHWAFVSAESQRQILLPP